MENSVAVDDVTKKIKVAITNKLIELGTYVDEELPDYIMVMVANKKSISNMTKDLSLFLGSNTENFTSWLHGILENVQTGPEEPVVASEKREDLKAKESPVSAKEKAKPVTSLSEPSSIPTNKRPPSPESSAVTSSDMREETEDVISFRTETDDVLTKELQQEEEKIISTNLKVIKPKTSTSSVEVQSTSLLTNKRVPISFLKKDSSSKMAIKIRPMLQRRSPLSTVSSVIRKPHRSRQIDFDDEIEEDDEYNPLKPSVGSVASVVRVSERRSSVPPARQASKLLLFKAMDDANKSITKISSVRGSARIAPYKPTPIEERVRTPEDESEMGETTDIDFVASDDRNFPDQEAELKEEVGVSVKKPTAVISTLRNPTLIPPVKIKRPVLTTLRKPILAGPINVENLVINEEIIKDVFDEIDKSMSEEVLDSLTPLVVDVPKKGVKRKIEDEIVNEDLNVENMPLSESTSHTRFVVTLDGVDPGSLFQTPVATLSSKFNNSNKRIFSQFPSTKGSEEIYNNDLELMEADDIDNEGDLICIDENHILIPTNVLDDSFNDTEIEKKNIRCQYWPACSRGESCNYIHPSKACKNFQTCRFGSKCINIHPNCKFDSQCTRPDCPFTHASKRNSVKSSQLNVPVPSSKFPKGVPRSMSGAGSAAAICKFFPKCTNANCPFIHPKMCRYNSFCKNTACPFTHPKTPAVEKLKWVAKSNSTLAPINENKNIKI